MKAELVTLGELPELIKKRMPQANVLKHLAILEVAQAVTFEWQGRKFAVRTTLEAFEVKGEQNLLITGASQLIEKVCRTTVANQMVIEEILKLLQGAEELARSQRDMALQKIVEAKNILARLAKPSGPATMKR